MRGARACCIALVLAAATPGRAQQAAPGLTSAPYDLSLFRDGETRRLHGHYGRWTVVCDEIIRLRSRYCSLAAPVADAAGSAVARIDVSTDEAGRPAALLHLPLGTLFDRPITLAPATGGASAPGRALRGTRCDDRDCALVWSLDPGDFAALKRGGLRLSYRRTGRVDLPGALLRPDDVDTLSGLVPSDGFAAAVAASLAAGPLAEGGPAATEGGPADGLGLRH